ncbi:unnamed protein product [Pleuronectes platessa]|uniref:Uncharacterized protein n=1 Tax=Pleuronectes platessa TaxID=8262 RepID=A0A9N7YV18_PLEPL|nr:unnamed protein product [Pleuronectes platessa]
MWVVLEPLPHLKAHIVPDDNVIDPLWVICLVRWYQQVMQAIQEDEETGSVIAPSTHYDVPTTLAGDLNNGPLANDVSAPSPPLHQVESHIINKDVLVQHMSCVMLLDQHENASYSMDTERSTQWAKGNVGVTSPFALPLHRMGSSSITPIWALTTHLTFSNVWTDYTTSSQQ